MMMMTVMGAGNLSRSRVRNARIDRRGDANRTSLHLWAFTSRARARVVTTARMNESMRMKEIRAIAAFHRASSAFSRALNVPEDAGARVWVIPTPR